MSNPVTKSAPAPAAAPVFPVWLLGALLASITLALYSPVLGHDFFYYDDDTYVLNNPHVTCGLTWNSVGWAFAKMYACNWHPLTWISHMLDCQIFGLKPWGPHLVNILWHAVDTVLAFLLLRRLTGALWRSAVVAALFAWHPVNVESVAWIAERKSVLSTFFGLLTLLFYTNYAQAILSQSRGAGREKVPRGIRSSSPAPVWRFYWLAWLCLALGLMSKSVLVTWPFVMLLLDYWPLRRWEQGRLWPLVLEKIPFFVLGVATSVWTFFVHEQGGDMVAIEGLSVGGRVANVVISYGRYLGKLFWPANLAFFYPLPAHWPMAEVLLVAACLLALTLVFFLLRSRYPFLLIGWLWFGGTLVPVVGLVQVGSQSMADRHAYIPGLGIFIMVVWGLHAAFQRWRHYRIGLSMAALVVMVLCLAATQRELGYWRDTETLARRALAVTEGNFVAHDLLGYALCQAGRTELAIGELQQAIALSPTYAWAHNNLGSLIFNKGQTDDAIAQFRDSIQLQPQYEPAYYNLGVALAKKGQLDEAERVFQKALKLEPDDAYAANDLGNLLAKQGQTDAAIVQFRTAIHGKPDYAQAHNQLGAALFKQGQTAVAITEYQTAVHDEPDYAEAQNNLGMALATQGQTELAITHFQAAVRLATNNFSYYDNLGIALTTQGQTNAAIRQFQHALRLQPNDPEAANDLGYLWVKQDEHLDEARTLIEKAVHVDPLDSDFLGSMAWVLLKLHQPAAGLDYALLAVTNANPPDAELYEHLGDIYVALNQRESAASAWHKSMTVKPSPAVQKKLEDLSMP